MGIEAFFKKAFGDMKDSAKAQHEVDKANMAAIKAESKAQWEEQRRSGSPKPVKWQCRHSATNKLQRQTNVRQKRKRALMRSINKRI